MTNDNNFNKWNRRDLLKTLGGVPLFGAVWYAGASIAGSAKREKQFLLETLNIKASPPPASGPMSGKPIRLGIIGYGIRGEQLCRALGFASTAWLKDMQEALEKNPKDTRLRDFKAQENLNIKLAAVCDVFDVRAEKALESFNTGDNKIKRFRTHTELINSGEVDAIVIATPDHWHAPMAIEALNAGVHVYVEKPMTHNIAETYLLRET
ncbi:MAG: Gfo/Idh/MocA family oxidoreductase, partial [Chitinophagaceae bacterium]|nr:Gfo/Idh/MocA family oxidoreductase [Chitinophagaceae bacterium]